MKLFTAMEDYTCGSQATYTLEDLEIIEMNLINEQRVLDNAVESYTDASTALKHLVKLEGLAPHNRGVYNVTMESINDQLGFPEGTRLASEGVGDSIKKFAKKVWAKIVAAYRAVRDWIRKLFGMAPIPSEGSLKKTDDIIKEAADKGPTIKTDGDATQLEKDVLNSITEEMKRAMVDVEREVEEAAKVRDDELAALAKKKATYAEHEAEAYAIEKKHNDIIVAKVREARKLAVLIKDNIQKSKGEHEIQAQLIDKDRNSVLGNTDEHEESERARHPEAYDIEMGISMNVVLKAAKLSTIMVTDYTTMKEKYAADEIKAIRPFLNDPTNTVVPEKKKVNIFDGLFEVEPYDRKGARINYIYNKPGGQWDVDFIHTGEDYEQIVANHEWFRTVTYTIDSIMEKLTPEHFDKDDNLVLLGNMLSDDLALVGRKKAALMKSMKRNNDLVRALMEDTNEATYRYLQDNYIASDTDNRNIKG